MRGKAENLTDKRFGHLVAQSRSVNDRQSNAQWLCKCDCGNEAIVRSTFLLKRQRFCSLACSLYAQENRLDLTGQRFGRLIVLKLAKVVKSKTYWACQCECGNTVDVMNSNLKLAHTVSCGCAQTKHGLSRMREYHREAHKRWSKRNPGKVIENVNRRRTEVRKRIPSWLTDEHREKINSFYLEAQRLTDLKGVPHHVDHIVPLRGRKVSGLHVPWNLQVLPAMENMRKHASFDDIC